MPETAHFGGVESEHQGEHSLRTNAVLHNRYKIVGILGGGGMGTVYQARDLNFTDVRKLVAIKEMQALQTDAATHVAMLKTFRREANILATLSHPAIPKIFDFFDLNERAYLVMEYINGSDLELLMTKTKELPLDKVIEWAITLCDVLDYLHNQKPDPIVFRDMKPSNIMIDSLGKARLIDFGIAKAFVQDAITPHTNIGTEGYSAPEQYRNKVTTQSDLYSLGATLHHIFTRKDPRMETPFTFHERPIPDLNPNVPLPLVRLIERAISREAHDRFATAAEMKAALEALRYSPVVSIANDYHAPMRTSAVVGGTDMFQDTNIASSVQPKWVFKAEDEIRAAPAAGKELAFVGAYDNNLWAIKHDTGDLVWKFATKGGIASAPAIDEPSRLVIFGSEDHTLHAVDYTRGRINWSYQTKDRIRSAPCIAHEHVFVGSDDGKVYALGLSTGRFLWSYDAAAPVRSRPAVTNDLVIFGAESGEVFGVSLSGTRKWSYRTKRGVISSPFVDMEEGICFIGSTDGFMYAIDITNGYNSWRFRTTGPIIASPVAHKGLLYFGSTDGILYAINAQSTKEKWRFVTEKPIVASPIVYKGAVYCGGSDDYFYCIDAESGKERWKYKTGGAITAAPAIAGDLILVGSMDHKLYAFPLVT